MSDHRAQPPTPPHHVEHHSQHASSHAFETYSAEQSSSPAPTRPRPDSVTRPTAERGVPGSGATSACRVIVADDNPAERTAIAVTLEKAGDIVVVAEAVDAVQACEAAQVHAPDVVLLDVRTPSGDACTALARLVSLAPVLLLTYDRDNESTQQALRQGALGYLVHGRFTDDELIAAVRAVRDTPDGGVGGSVGGSVGGGLREARS